MALDVEIRQATKADVEAIVELWKEFIDFHGERDPLFTRSENGAERFGEYVGKNIEDGDWLVVVAFEQQRPIGYCTATIMEYPPVLVTKKYGYLQDVAVTEQFRRCGVGSRLCRHAEQWLRDRGVSRIELSVAAANPASQAFWSRMGYRDALHRMAKEL